uniref:Uncharacterized protein TCIL3000_7_3370 n=1 Tax=Trypanosoma congolense (strain IL3000) TaxID=1068625 RepID=G0UQ62_TRYCI|nr:unnamed protein product [Trypanosoma congolense IL3000]
MIQFGQLVCFKCRKILSYPLGAPSCRCRNCETINPAQNIHVTCGCCEQPILVPINTLTFLCPCCATVTDIPQSLLPPVEGPVNRGNDAEKAAKTIYVTYPAKSKLKKESEVKEEDKSALGGAQQERGGGNIVMGAVPQEDHGEGRGTTGGEGQLVGDGALSATNRHEAQNVIMIVGTRVL